MTDTTVYTHTVSYQHSHSRHIHRHLFCDRSFMTAQKWAEEFRDVFDALSSVTIHYCGPVKDEPDLLSYVPPMYHNERTR